MKQWELFEETVLNYLNQNFGKYATFSLLGGTDSTKSDILVKPKTKSSFFIDAKHTPAQCGQFVLLPDIKSKTFIYSPLNKTPLDYSAKRIINHMNQHFEEFKEAGTAGKEIVFTDCKNIFAERIVTTYKYKNCKFFITNGYLIFPVAEILNFFDIGAKYRIKRSGSGNVGRNNLEVVSNYISDRGYQINEFIFENDKLFVTSTQNLHNRRFILANHEYMFSKRNDRYEIRKLSNTFNANVIFDVSLKNGVSKTDINEFLESIG